ncbi:MAG: hypothetical protein OEY64_10950 [Nitrospinota bacterium]|nr:hypothetical protein [Nitrospinota bacterium]
MVIADAIKYGNLPVMNTAELGTIGIDKLELDNETSLFTIHESIYFPLNFFPLEEPLRPFHYKHPSILSVFRLLSLDMAYPLLQLFELVIFKLSIISMIFLFINYETGKALLGFAGASIYIFSGSWLMLSNLSEWLFIMNNVSPTEYSSSYRLAFGNAISFGYPTTLIQNPDIIIDFMTGTFFLFGFFYFLKKETSTLTLLAPILLMVFFMKNGTGFGYISSALILSLMLTYHKLIKENTSQYKLVFLTGILLLAVSSITFKWTLDFYNVYFTDNLKLLQKETLYFVKWESETFPLGQIGSWIKLFLQTGNILIFMPLVIFLAKDRSVSFLNHSLFIGGIFLADITVGFLFLGFNWPDWNMTRFWTFSFHYWNIAIAISWSIWIMKTRFNRAVKIIVSAPLAVSIIIQFIFIFGLTKYASYIHLVNAF